MVKKYLFANWKMYVAGARALAVARAWQAAVANQSRGLTVAVFPDFVDLEPVKAVFKKSAVLLGAQDCAAAENGAQTGEVSAHELRRVGCRYVLIGHSERRWQLGETEKIIAKKYVAAAAAKMVPVLCVGERTKVTSTAAITLVRRQLRTLAATIACRPVIAYEPSWAIGTGRVAPLEHIVTVIDAIRETLVKIYGAAGRNVPVLYGGSVNSKNFKTLAGAAEVDGLLVGRASVKLKEIPKLVRAFI